MAYGIVSTARMAFTPVGDHQSVANITFHELLREGKRHHALLKLGGGFG